MLRGRIGYDPAMMYIDTKPNCTSLNAAKMWQTERQFSGNESGASERWTAVRLSGSLRESDSMRYQGKERQKNSIRILFKAVDM